MRSLSVSELFDAHARKLSLSWRAGNQGGGRALCALDAKEAGHSGLAPGEKDDSAPASCRTLIGHLSLIHPNQIQVMGNHEIDYLAGLAEDSYKDMVERTFGGDPICVIVADGLVPDSLILERAEITDTPLLTTPLSGDEIVSHLSYYLSRELAVHQTIHGVFLEVAGAGVLVTGASGIGKSELALELISRGHRLIADDAPQFTRIAPDTVLGSCPRELINFLEVRGIGILNVRALFGDSAIKRDKFLRLIVNLEPLDDENIKNIDRLEGSQRNKWVLGVEIPEVTLPVAAGRNLAVLVECAARNQIMRAKGYDAAKDFIAKQREYVSQNSK